MGPIPLLCLFLLAICRPADAGQKSVTFYLDGARIEHQLSPLKGYLEHPLPDSFIPGTVRVRPAGDGKVLRVEVVPADQDRRRAGEVARLQERKGRLLDRLQILGQREEIFSAAAKSQSGKAPRKSKSTPDPIDSLQQGTEFALSRLEATCRSRLKCQREIETIDRKLASARKGSAVVRIWISGRRVTLSYQVSGERWSAQYDFRWSGDAGGELLLHAKLPSLEKGVQYAVANGTLAEEVGSKLVRGQYPVIAHHPLKLEGRSRRDEKPVSFTFAPVEAALPPGDASAFWRGEYLGCGRFAGGGATRLLIGE